MSQSTFTAAYDEALQALRRLRGLVGLIDTIDSLDTYARSDVALLLVHPEIQALTFDDEGTDMNNLIAALIAYREITIDERAWLGQTLRELVQHMAAAIEAMAACGRTLGKEEA